MAGGGLTLAVGHAASEARAAELQTEKRAQVGNLGVNSFSGLSRVNQQRLGWTAGKPEYYYE